MMDGLTSYAYGRRAFRMLLPCPVRPIEAVYGWQAAHAEAEADREKEAQRKLAGIGYWGDFNAA